MKTDDGRASVVFPLRAVPMNIEMVSTPAGDVRIEQYEVSRSEREGFIFYQALLPQDPDDVVVDSALDSACEAIQREGIRLKMGDIEQAGLPGREVLGASVDFSTRSRILLDPNGVHLYMLQVTRETQEELENEESEAFLDSLKLH